MFNNINGLNFNKTINPLKHKRGGQNLSVDKSMTKDGSIMIRKANVGDLGTRTSNTQKSISTNMTVSHDVSDPTKVNYQALNQYSKDELETIKQGITEMMDSDITRSASMSLQSKLSKVNAALAQANQTGASSQSDTSSEVQNGTTQHNTQKEKNLADQQAAEQAYQQAQSSVGGVGLIATTQATAKENKAGDKTKDATNFMNSENDRMNKQASQNEKYNKETEEKTAKLVSKQKTDMKKQIVEENKISEEQKVMETNSHEAEELQSNFNVDDAKTEEEATTRQNEFNTKLDNKTSLLQKSNTTISQTNRKIYNINKQYKNNVKSSESIRHNTHQHNVAYKNSIAVASSNVTNARTTAGATSGIADAASKVGQASQMLGQSVAQVGKAMQSNPYTKAAGIAMEKYGNMTSMAAGITMSVAPTVQNLAGGTNAASGVTQSSAYDAAGVNKVTAKHSKRAQVVTKSLNNQIKVANKSSNKTRQAAQQTFMTSQNTMFNTKNAVNNSTASRINDINTTNINKSNNNIGQNTNNNLLGLNSKNKTPNSMNPLNAGAVIGQLNNQNSNISNSKNSNNINNTSQDLSTNEHNKKKLKFN